MKIYRDQNVLEAAKQRIGWLFDEFENVVIATSGGKDSTVIFHLAIQIAAQRGRLPLRVLWIDQESEWQSTADEVKRIMYRLDVHPMWLQIPFRLSNATSTIDHWLNCWDPKEKHRWIRQQDPIAITENIYGADRFHDVFPRVLQKHFGSQPACIIGGVRAEESTRRYMAVSSGSATYKGVTWGTQKNKKKPHFTFYPIYDWTFSDVWKAINDHGWHYNSLYDAQYKYGVSIQNMRVSNLNHETALLNLFYMQEVEPVTFDALAKRLAGVNSANHFGADDYFTKELPPMFSDWRDYRDHLVSTLITNQKWVVIFRREFAKDDALYGGTDLEQRILKSHVFSVLTNDFELTKIKNCRNKAAWSLTGQVIQERNRKNRVDRKSKKTTENNGRQCRQHQ